MAKILNLDNFIFEEAISAIDIAFDTQKWADSVGISLVENQIEIVDEICKPEPSNIVVLASRSAGKTYAVAISAIRLCISMPGYAVLVFGPRAAQAKRIITEITKICKLSYLKDDVDWDRTSMSKMHFKNASSIEAISANESTEVEGWHGDLCILDESHRISDLVYTKRIVPMFRSSAQPKYVKIGISMYNNHFRQSFESPGWKKLVYPWYKCPWLYRSQLIEIDGIKYPKSIIDDMPLSYKRERFPDRTDLHYPSLSGMLEEDFDTQYEMKWVDSLNVFLKAEDQAKLIGNHIPLENGNATDKYYFGLDLAGGSEIQQDKKHDYTSLTVVRLTSEGVREVVWVGEWQGDIMVQIPEIVSVIHPVYGKFKCVRGCADYGNLGSAVVDWMKNEGIPVVGIRNKATETKTGKNYKNALFEQFLFDLRHDKFKYPDNVYISRNKVLKSHIDEWCALERRRSSNGVNDIIEAPNSAGMHDDHPNSTVLCNWSVDRVEDKSDSKPKVVYRLPGLVVSTHSSVNRNMSNNTNKFLR